MDSNIQPPTSNFHNMRDVYILGIGQTEVGEHWETSLRHLALEAVEAALKDADIKYPDAMYVGNMLAPQLSDQSHLGAHRRLLWLARNRGGHRGSG